MPVAPRPKPRPTRRRIGCNGRRCSAVLSLVLVTSVARRAGASEIFEDNNAFLGCGGNASTACETGGYCVQVGMHPDGWFGTKSSPTARVPDSCVPTLASARRSWGSRGGLGFVADYGKDGWAVAAVPGAPTFSGDYFLPGSPCEGWSLEFQTSADGYETVWRNKNKHPYRGDMSSAEIKNTSDASKESALWVSTKSITTGWDIKVSKIVQIRPGDLFFTIKVTLQNLGPDKLHNVEYMRNVDPDNDQPHTGRYSTYNYVKYQPFREGDPPGRTHPNSTATALVMAYGAASDPAGKAYNYIGLGTVDPHARVNHRGFCNDDADLSWSSTAWHRYSEASPRYDDEGIDLVPVNVSRSTFTD